MADDPFDGLADPLAEAPGFGEPVIYIPIATGIALGDAGTIQGIWCEDHQLGMFDVKSDQQSVRCEVRASDVGSCLEGDTIERVKTAYKGQVVPPIVPDGHGLICVTLQKIT